MSLTIVKRAGWLAAPARTRAVLDPDARRGVVVHWNGPKITQPEHGGCARVVRSIQRFHMDSKGWRDGAYSHVVCQHGVVFEMRGWDGVQWANGSVDPPAGTGRTDLRPTESWYTVLVLTGGDHDRAGRLVDEQPPTPAAVAALGAYVVEARRRGAGDRVLPHNDFRVKTCPGTTLTALARRWDRRPIEIPEEDEMVSLADDERGQSWLRKLLGAGGGKTVTGVTEAAFNDLHADLTAVQANQTAMAADVAEIKRLLAQRPAG